MRAENADVSKTGRLFDSRWFGDHGIGRFAQEVYRRLAGFGTPAFSGRPWHALDVLTTSWHLRVLRPSFYFSPGYNAPLACPCPFALTIHDLNHLATPGQSTALKRLYYRSILKPAVHRAAVVLTVSEYSKAAIVAWSGVDSMKVVNVSNGVSPAFQAGTQAQRADKPYFLAIASWKQHKNQLGLLQAYARSRSRHEVDLLLLGCSDDRLQEWLERLRIAGSVRFLGRLSDAQLAAAYRGAVGFLFVSHYEGFGLPIIEAMACGTPVITSAVTAMPEVAGAAAILIDPQSIDQIADAMDRLCDSSQLRAALKEQGLLRASQFTWDETARRVRKALETSA